MINQHNLTAGRSLILLTSTVLLALGGCTSIANQSAPNQSNATATTSNQAAAIPEQQVNKPLVVVTSSVTCGLIREIAEETVQLRCLIEPGIDAHEYQMKPQDGKAIESADLIFYSGYNLEPSLTRAIQNTSNPAPKVALDQLAVPKPLLAAAHDHEGETEHDHDHGEQDAAKAEADPHIWHNAKHGIRMAEIIRDRLSQLLPAEAARYATNTKKLTNELSQLDAWIRVQIATIPIAQRRLITTHHALGYYAQAYSIPVKGALEGINTKEKPSAGRIKALVEEIRAEQVPTIFPEVSINPQLIQQVAREAGVKVSEQQLYADGLGAKGTDGETYQKMLVANTKAIVEGLGGTFTPFQLKP